MADMSEYPQSETAMLLRIQQLEEEKRQQEEFYGNRIGILEARDLQLERDVEWLHKAEDRIQQLEEALRHARWVIASYTAGQEKYLAPIDAALSREPSEAPEKEQ